MIEDGERGGESMGEEREKEEKVLKLLVYYSVRRYRSVTKNRLHDPTGQNADECRWKNGDGTALGLLHSETRP